MPMAPTAGMRLNEGRWMPDRRSGVVIFPKGDNDEWWWRGCETDAGCEGVRKRQEERFEIGSEIVFFFFFEVQRLRIHKVRIFQGVSASV